MTLTSTITPGGGRARPQPAVHRLRGVSSRDRDWDGVRLHVVTGKGGTGKTTVAAALALALAAEGCRVLLVEVEERHGIAPLFGLTRVLCGTRNRRRRQRRHGLRARRRR